MSQEEKPQPAPQSDASSQNEPCEADALKSRAEAEVGEFAADDSGIDVESVASHLASDLGRLQAELEEAQNRALRSSAELENFRRRANRQMAEELRYANLELFRELLPIWDNMGRTVDAALKTAEAGSLLEGFKMVHAQLESVFQRFHCVRIEAEGQPFDPHVHEAISQMPSADHPPGTVLFVTQVGFVLHDRVVRPCRVVVSTSPPDMQQSQSRGVEETTVQGTADADSLNEEQG